MIQGRMAAKRVLATINLHKSGAASQIAKKKILEDYAITCFQEPNVRQGKIIGLSGLNMVYAEAEVPKVGIATHPNIQIINLSRNGDLSNATVRVPTESGPRNCLMVTSVYWNKANDLRVDLARMDRIARIAEGRPLVIMGDTNAWSVLWGDVLTDNGGEALEGWLAVNNLVVLNEGNEPTLPSANGTSIPDLVIANGMAERKLLSFRVAQESTGSDHSRLEVEYGEGWCESTLTGTRLIKPGSLRTTKFTEVLMGGITVVQERLSQVSGEEAVEGTAHTFQNLVKKAMLRAGSAPWGGAWEEQIEDGGLIKLK